MRYFSSSMCGVFIGTAAIFGSTQAMAAVLPSNVVSVDINVDPVGAPLSPTYSGPAAVVGAGSTWNAYDTIFSGSVFSPPVSGPLLASDGSATTTTFKLDNIPGGGYFDNFTPYVANSLQRDGVAAQAAPVSFTIGGLNNALTYDVYLYGVSVGSEDQGNPSIGGPFPRATTFTIGSSSLSTNGLGATDGTSATGTFVSGQDYVLFSNVSPVSGAITGSFTRANGAQQEGNFNGFQIAVVPEPGTIGVLAAVGLLGLTKRRRTSM
jgi:hypothetical protein